MCLSTCDVLLAVYHLPLGVLKTKTPTNPKTPKTPKLENKDLPYFGGLQNYDQPVANATES